MKNPAPPPSEGDVNVSPARAAWRASLSERARAALDEDERFFLRQSLSTPCLTGIVRAEGAVLTDIDGRRIFDFHGNSVHQLGHGHPKVVAAIRREMETLPFCPRRYANPTATALARRLVETSPAGLDKVLLAPSGAAAISMALKLARYATGRHKTLSLWDSFHGANLDTIGVGGEALFRSGLGPMAPGAEHLPPLDLARRFFGDDRPFERFADYIDYVLEVQGDVGALIAEPMRWTSVEAPPPDFWPRVRASCARHGALLIFDEIPSCLARTGTLYACEQLGATPDILVGLGGGIMPLAAILAAQRLDCAPEAALGHYTHEKSPVACAAALATLEVYTNEGLLTRAASLASEWENAMHSLRGLPHVLDVRNYGLIGAVDLEPRAGKPGARAFEVFLKCFERGVMVRQTGDTIAMSPPLIIESKQIARLVETLESVIRETA
jgi:4-aminobutyrate aminotransferase